MTNSGRGRATNLSRRLVGLGLLLLGGCAMIGPDFETPASDKAKGWMEQGDHRLSQRSDEHREWWRLFNDPILDLSLIHI